MLPSAPRLSEVGDPGERGNFALALNADASYANKPFDESRVCQGFATFQPCFGGFKVSRANAGSSMPTIALVDDDRNILTSVSIALEAEGYRI